MSAVKEEGLTKKIKTLEIQLDEYKKKDEQNKLLRKLKVEIFMLYIKYNCVLYISFSILF